MHRAFGDSITSGAEASTPANRFISRLNQALAVQFKNLAVPGSMVMDQEAAVYAETFAPGDVTLLGFGVNDQAKYVDDAAKRGYFIDGLRAYAILAGTTAKVANPQNGVTFSGVWSNSYSYGTYGSAAPGSKASFSVVGSSVALGFMRQTGNTSTFRVKIDGQSKGVYSSGGDLTTVKGKPYGPMCLLFKSLGAGTHQVEIEVVNGDGYYPVYFRFFSGCDRSAKVCVLTVPRAVKYIGGGSAENVALYNASISTMVGELQSIGLEVLLADVTSLLKPEDMYDDVHPADSGHLKYFAAISGQLLTPPLGINLGLCFSGSDGNLYAATSAGLRKILTE